MIPTTRSFVADRYHLVTGPSLGDIGIRTFMVGHSAQHLTELFGFLAELLEMYDD